MSVILSELEARGGLPERIAHPRRHLRRQVSMDNWRASVLGSLPAQGLADIGEHRAKSAIRASAQFCNRKNLGACFQHPAALHRTRDAEALAILCDGAAGDLDAEFGEDLHNLVV